MTGDSNISALPNLVLGCVAEWAHLPVTLPIDCVTTAIQTDDKNRGAFVLMGNILSEKVRTISLGFGPYRFQCEYGTSYIS